MGVSATPAAQAESIKNIPAIRSTRLTTRPGHDTGLTMPAILSAKSARGRRLAWLVLELRLNREANRLEMDFNRVRDGHCVASP